MFAKLAEFHTLSKQEKNAANPKVTAIKVELARVEADIENLIDTLSGASDILISYANDKIAGLDSRKQALNKELADIAAVAVPVEKILHVSKILDDWSNNGIEGKREVIDRGCIFSRVNGNNLHNKKKEVMK